MKIIASTAASAVLALSLAACGTTGGSHAATDLLKSVITDPNCAHDDDITVSAGGLTGPTITGHAGRHCPGPTAAPVVASVNGVTVGTVVAPAKP